MSRPAFTPQPQTITAEGRRLSWQVERSKVTGQSSRSRTWCGGWNGYGIRSVSSALWRCWGLVPPWRRRSSDTSPWVPLLQTKAPFVKAPSTPATMSKQHSTFVATNGNNVERFYCKISSFRQSRNELNTFSLFRLCRKDEISFDIVAENGHIVAKNGTNFEATFDIVERIVKLVAFDIVAGVDGA